MSLRNIVSAWLRSVIANHLGLNVKSYKFRVYADEPSHNMLGGVSFLDPAQGKVCETDEAWTLIKKKPSEFDVIQTNLLSEPVCPGDTVAITYYQLRRFDGSRADGSDDPPVNGMKTFMLTGAKTLLPVKWQGRYLPAGNDRLAEAWPTITNPYLRDLIGQVEEIAVDGRRCIANVLVDAGATSMRFFDTPETSVEEPGFAVDVATAKFRGEVRITYNRGLDMYNITFTPAGQADQPVDGVQWFDGNTLEAATIEQPLTAPRRFSNLTCEDLGPTLMAIIDDGSWLKAKVTVIKKAPKPRVVKQSEVAL